MKNPSTFLILLFSLSLMAMKSSAQPGELKGAWSQSQGAENHVLLFQDGYFTHTVYTDDEFLYTYGGTYTANNGQLAVQVEFNSRENDGDRPMLSLKTAFELKDNGLQIEFGGQDFSFARLDDSKAPLAGVWQITDRLENGTMVPIQRSGTRKSLKMLTGSRFQWFAIDPATRNFNGTGGGSYTFVDGKYTEKIDVFSRDNDRVGASLLFEGKVEDGKWHHKGLSSKGDEIYEIWGRVNK